MSPTSYRTAPPRVRRPARCTVRVVRTNRTPKCITLKQGRKGSGALRRRRGAIDRHEQRDVNPRRDAGVGPVAHRQLRTALLDQLVLPTLAALADKRFPQQP